jgi:hypothetical protein
MDGHPALRSAAHSIGMAQGLPHQCRRPPGPDPAQRAGLQCGLGGWPEGAADTRARLRPTNRPTACLRPVSWMRRPMRASSACPDAWNDDNPANDSQCTVVQLPAVAAPPAAAQPAQAAGSGMAGRVSAIPAFSSAVGAAARSYVEPGPAPWQGSSATIADSASARWARNPDGGAPAARSIRAPAHRRARFPGQFRNSKSQQCVCPAGQQVIRGRCRQPARACTADRVLRNGECVCPTGFVERNGRCEPAMVADRPRPSGGGPMIPRSVPGQLPAQQHIRGFWVNCIPVR